MKDETIMQERAQARMSSPKNKWAKEEEEVQKM